ncbi:hypothetical protein OPV22_026835 [Ensete ventricosum]|uniref:NADPH oxidase Respiratory burst domain-containing protein n=1 Tax=Ensete ventricosum TaxID=4639 RepID=A0AAV8Q3N8_ENSVE|nr:hypothetical protein OPV22_026835 [Ensete ventricosum]
MRAGDARPDDRSENISMDRDVSMTSKGHAFWLAVVNASTSFRRRRPSPLPKCIGMKESSDFAGELFDALKRRRNITGDKITKADGAEGVLGSNLRSKLRFPPPDLLRHGGQGLGTEGSQKRRSRRSYR